MSIDTTHSTATLASVPPGIRPVFERLVADGPRYFGSPVLRVEAIRIVQRVFSTLARMRIETAAESTQVYVKRVHAATGEPDEHVRSRVVREYAQTRRAYEALKAQDGFAAIRPLAVFPDLHVFVAEAAGGETLQSLVRRGARPLARSSDTDALARVVRRIGRWLRAYQSLKISGGALSLTEARDYVRVRMDRLCDGERTVFAPGDRTRMLDAFDRWALELEADDLEPVQLHADFNPENILVDGDQIAVLDFSEAHPGLRLADVVHLYLHLERLKTRLRFSEAAVARLQSELLAGYGEPDMLATPLARMLVLQQAAAYLVLLTNQCPPHVAWARRPYLRLKRYQTFQMLERLGVLPA